MRVALVGGTLFIGRATAEALVARGHEVAVVHRGVHPSQVDGARSVVADRTDPAALRAALVGLAPDAVIAPRAMTAAAATTTLRAGEGLEAPVVVLSSQDVYAQFGRLNGLPAPEPEVRITEASPLTVPYPFRGIAEHAGGDEYDKKDVERLFLAAADGALPGATVLRLPAVYGRRDPQRRFGGLVDALDAGAPRVPGDGAFRWTHGHVDNVAHAIVLATEAPPAGGRLFNVGERDTPTLRERADAIAQVVGVPIEWTGEEATDAWGMYGPMPNDVVVDTTALRDALGFEEVVSADGRLRDLVAGLRASRA